MGNGGKQEMKKEDTEMMLRIFETERAGYAYLWENEFNVLKLREEKGKR